MLWRATPSKTATSPCVVYLKQKHQHGLYITCTLLYLRMEIQMTSTGKIMLLVQICNYKTMFHLWLSYFLGNLGYCFKQVLTTIPQNSFCPRGTRGETNFVTFFSSFKYINKCPWIFSFSRCQLLILVYYNPTFSHCHMINIFSFVCWRSSRRRIAFNSSQPSFKNWSS